MPTIEIILKAIGAQSVKSELKGVSDSAKQIGSEVKAIAADGGLKQAEEKAKHYQDAMKSARAETENLRSSLEGMRNAGVVMAGVGAAGIVLSNTLIRVAEEGARADAKLTAMFSKRGEGGRVEELKNWASDLSMQAAMVDDDPIKEAAAGLAGFGLKADQVKQIMPGLIGQSRLYNQSLETVAMAFGKAFGKGDVTSLTKAGVLISPDDIEKLESITDYGERQAFMFKLVKKSMDDYALSITEGMSDSEKAANRAKNQLDSLMTNIGQGSAVADAKIKTLAISILSLGNASPEAERGAGALLTYGSYAVTAAGGVMTFLSQVALAKLGLRELAAARAADTLAAEQNTAANLANANAISGASVQAAGASRGLGMMSKGMGVLSALVIPAILIPIGTMIIDAVANHFGGKNAADSRADAIGTITGDRVGINARAGRNQYQARLDALEADATKRVFENRMTQAASDAQLLKDKLALEKQYAAEFARVGATADATEHQKKYNDLMRQMSTPAAAGVDAASPAAGGAAMAAGAPSLAAGGDTDAMEEQIQGLQDQIRRTKDKDVKAALREQLIAVQRRARATKANNAAEEKAARKAEREAEKATKARIEDERDANSVRAVDIDESFLTRITRLEIERDKARDGKDKAREKQLNNEIEKLKIEQQYAQDKIRADDTALENEKGAAAIMAQANRRRAGALERLALRAAAESATAAGASRFGAVRLPSIAAAAGALNPFAGKDYGSSFTSMVTGGSLYRDITQNMMGGTAAALGYTPTGHLPQVERVRGSVYDNGRGDQVIQFEPVVVRNDLRRSAALLPGG